MYIYIVIVTIKTINYFRSDIIFKKITILLNHFRFNKFVENMFLIDCTLHSQDATGCNQFCTNVQGSNSTTALNNFEILHFFAPNGTGLFQFIIKIGNFFYVIKNVLYFYYMMPFFKWTLQFKQKFFYNDRNNLNCSLCFPFLIKN